jgi:hypothetical protein
MQRDIGARLSADRLCNVTEARLSSNRLALTESSLTCHASFNKTIFNKAKTMLYGCTSFEGSRVSPEIL